MRLFGFLIVIIAVGIAVGAWLNRAGSAVEPANMLMPTARIHVTGPGNTLASVAAQADDPAVFAYDPTTRMAVSYASLIIEGELQLGAPGDEASGEILELATEVCGDLRIEVRPGGALRLYHSQLRTLSKVLSTGACSRGFSMFVDGSLTLADSKINYLSGSRSEFLRGGAQALIERTIFDHCDGNALSLVDVDGKRVVLEKCDLLSKANWGLAIHGSGGEPIEVRDCLLAGQLAALFVTGTDARALIVHCVLVHGCIMFNGLSGQVDVCWSRQVKVTDQKTQRPAAGVMVRGAAINDGQVSAAINVEGRTDGQGQVELIVPQWIARPWMAAMQVGNTVGPIALSVIGPDGAAVAGPVISVTGKDREVVLIELQ